MISFVLKKPLKRQLLWQSRHPESLDISTAIVRSPEWWQHVGEIGKPEGGIHQAQASDRFPGLRSSQDVMPTDFQHAQPRQ
ncbi:hypothetical protein [Rhizobium leguminosarum]|uniref:hypothetical protein n=1 Tax=Rhizobium leguminosarum TaxID=384 RepID=UPI0013E9474C|nr:hypothetical protein [Rhizobium leguminosarum]